MRNDAGPRPDPGEENVNVNVKPSARRRPSWVVPVLAATLAVCLGLGVAALTRVQRPDHGAEALTNSAAAPAVPVSAAEFVVDPMGPETVTGPNVGEVTCDADGKIRIATPVVQAQHDGVHLRWTTRAKRTNVGWDEGGTAVAAGTQDLVVAAEPAKLTLTCSVDGNETMSEAALEVVDPTGSWMGERTNLICAGGIGAASWAIAPSVASTRREAVEDLAASMGLSGRSLLAIGRAPIGYVGSAQQTWTIDSSTAIAGTAPVAYAISVRRLAADRFEASPNWICMRGNVPDTGEPTYAPQGTVPAETPDIVDVSCADGRLQASTTTVRARAEGVVFRSTSSKEWALNWETRNGAGSARPIGATGATLTEQITPGTARLSCSDDRSAFVDLRVVDPDGMYLGSDLSHVCPALSVFDTDAQGWGNTPREAAMDLARRDQPRRTAVVSRAPLGYVASQWPAWTLRYQDPTSSAQELKLEVATVVPNDAGEAHFVARPEYWCES